jgi:BMFP domain-containing protein YqiC
MTNNYQERHEDINQPVKDLEGDLEIVRMDLVESEEQNEMKDEKIRELEKKVRMLEAKLKKVNVKNEEAKVDK